MTLKESFEKAGRWGRKRKTTQHWFLKRGTWSTDGKAVGIRGKHDDRLRLYERVEESSDATERICGPKEVGQRRMGGSGWASGEIILPV